MIHRLKVQGPKTLFAWLTMVLLILHSCEEPITMASNDVESASERVNLLKKEILAPSEFFDAEFQLLNANGFSSTFQRPSIPAPSTWRYQYAVMVSQSDIPKWTEGLELTKTTLPDQALTWAQELRNKRPRHWLTTGKPLCYTYEAPGHEVMVLSYPEDSILFKRVIQN